MHCAVVTESLPKCDRDEFGALPHAEKGLSTSENGLRKHAAAKLVVLFERIYLTTCDL
jgi:hypothetical protein